MRLRNDATFTPDPVSSIHSRLLLHLHPSHSRWVFSRRFTALNPRRTETVIDYLAKLSAGKIVLWCYLIWYVNVLAHYFDPAPRLWLTSLGISGIVGVALILSTAPARSAGGAALSHMDRWVLFRLFLMPFCVSSFSALVKGQGFVLVFSPRWTENGIAFAAIVLFLSLVGALKFRARPTGAPADPSGAA